ncbi:MAG: hypothetical protein R2748_03285 [Bryobacterales bacterium]
MSSARATWCFLLLAALSGCVQNEPGIPIEEEEGAPPAQLLSNVNVADPRAAPQLLRGFHGLEQQAWRWTERKFAVMLQPPPPGQPVVLNLTFTLPGVVTDEVGPITMTARINGQQVGARNLRFAGREQAVRGHRAGRPADQHNPPKSSSSSTKRCRRATATRGVGHHRFFRRLSVSGKAKSGSLLWWALPPLLLYAVYWKGLFVWFHGDDFTLIEHVRADRAVLGAAVRRGHRAPTGR